MEALNYWQRLAKRRLSRRRLLAGAAAGGAGLAALSLVGCGGGEEGPAGTAGPTGTPSATATAVATGTPIVLEPAKTRYPWTPSTPISASSGLCITCREPSSAKS
jgi:hypothetical protein